MSAGVNGALNGVLVSSDGRRWIVISPESTSAADGVWSADGRKLGRSFEEDYRELARQLQTTEAYKKALRKRQVWVEPLFGEAKAWHQLRRFRLRGLENVNLQGLLVAAGQNLKRWLTKTGWGRRHGPAGSLADTG